MSDGREDFDFYHGRWRIENRRLIRRLEACTEWEEFEAIGKCRPILGGIGNADAFEATFPDGKTIHGFTLRIFDPATRDWSIYWADNWRCQLFPPVVGHFTNGEGAFYGDESCNGKPIRVVFYWREITPDSAVWEQAFSPDGGKTWEMNWRMRQTRLE